MGFIPLYKVGFIGCGRLIKSLTLELRLGVNAGDKGIDEEGWYFLCVCFCVRGRVSSGSYSTNRQGTKGRTGPGLQRLDTGFLSLTEEHFLRCKSEKEKAARGDVHEGQR